MGKKTGNDQGRRIDAEGIRYFALGNRRKNAVSNTKKRHISARTTEKWRFWIILLVSILLLITLQGIWRELKMIIP